MNNTLEILSQTRNNFTKLIDNLSKDKLNAIPKGFNNNIFWNYAHNVVTQQLLCYKLSNQKTYLSNDLIDEFKKGAKPSILYTEKDIVLFKELSISTLDNLKEDYKIGKFKEFKEYPTSYGFVLKSIEDAISFNNIHESLHFGYAMAQVRALG